MNNACQIRLAESSDLDQLLNIETSCFQIDRLSKRSFKRFIKPGAHQFIVLIENQTVFAYALILYRAGTNLARLYSIAVLPEYQGRGYSKLLLNRVEELAADKHCVFLRLEVDVNNISAISLYKKYAYSVIGRIPHYYENGADAIRMEKHIQLSVENKHSVKPYYQQTTDFTCGPASLMMAIKSLKPDYKMTRQEELQIWRESTTIFMTAGHGGCSPHGLALSAWRKGFNVTLHINQHDAPFLDGVRSSEKKSVIQLVHDDFVSQIKQTKIQLKVHDLQLDELDLLLRSGKPILALISTWRLNRNKSPHWVYVTGSDDHYVYINDPDIDEDVHLTQTDYIQVPIDKIIFREMAQFGQKKLRCLLVLTGSRDVD